MHANIIGTGSYLPAKVVTNADLAQRVDTSDDWIVTRTGIRERHIASDDENASDLALKASQRALEAAGIGADQLGLLIVATTTPDMIFPSTACILQSKLGVRGFPCFDVQAVCSGFVYALSIADLFVRSRQCRYALVVGAEVYSRILNWEDRSTCVLFGDGAGAVVLGASETPGILGTCLHADGAHTKMLSVPGQVCSGGVRGTPYVTMEGNSVFKFAVRVLEEAVTELLTRHKLEAQAIDWLIPHQANLRIIEATARKLGVGMERVVVTVDRHANTSAASIPLALDEAVRDGRIKPGQHVMLEAVGGGFTWGAALIRWA
jgi:3-oxoacyl-[acyl-carrier-protein] synthase-3